MSLEVEILQLAQTQIEANTKIRACLIGTNPKGYTQYPYAELLISGGDKYGPDANGSLDETWYLNIMITSRNIQDFYDVVAVLKTLWLPTGVGTEFQAMRDLGVDGTGGLKVLAIDPVFPVGFPWTLPLNQNDQIVKGSISFRLRVRHSY